MFSTGAVGLLVGAVSQEASAADGVAVLAVHLAEVLRCRPTGETRPADSSGTRGVM